MRKQCLPASAPLRMIFVEAQGFFMEGKDEIRVIRQ
jgi:hypothetical protein